MTSRMMKVLRVNLLVVCVRTFTGLNYTFTDD